MNNATAVRRTCAASPRATKNFRQVSFQAATVGNSGLGVDIDTHFEFLVLEFDAVEKASQDPQTLFDLLADLSHTVERDHELA
jgi:hypothetical protein